MKNNYIPVEVEREDKCERWYLDVNNLGLEELITLKNQLNGASVQCLDAMIYNKTCSSTFIHQMNNERKEAAKRNYKNKMRRRNENKSSIKRR